MRRSKASCADLPSTTRTRGEQVAARLPSRHRLDAADRSLSVGIGSLCGNRNLDRSRRYESLLVLCHHREDMLSGREKNLGVDRIVESEIHSQLIDVHPHKEHRIFRGCARDHIHRGRDCGIRHGVGHAERKVVRSILPGSRTFIFRSRRGKIALSRILKRPCNLLRRDRRKVWLRWSANRRWRGSLAHTRPAGARERCQQSNQSQ